MNVCMFKKADVLKVYVGITMICVSDLKYVDSGLEEKSVFGRKNAFLL